MSRSVDPAALRTAVAAVVDWLHDETLPPPDRAALAAAVRLAARTLAAVAPGASVEVRIPPFVAVQCISGPRHTRGTPPNVIETDPATLLALLDGKIGFAAAKAEHRVAASGVHADLGPLLPL